MVCERAHRAGGCERCTMARRIEQKSGRRWALSFSLSVRWSDLRNRSWKGERRVGLRGARETAGQKRRVTRVRACVRTCLRGSVGCVWLVCARLYIEAVGWPRATVEVYVVIQWPCELDYTLRSRVFHERADIRPFVTPWPAGRKHVA